VFSRYLAHSFVKVVERPWVFGFAKVGTVILAACSAVAQQSNNRAASATHVHTSKQADAKRASVSFSSSTVSSIHVPAPRHPATSRSLCLLLLFNDIFGLAARRRRRSHYPEPQHAPQSASTIPGLHRVFFALLAKVCHNTISSLPLFAPFAARTVTCHL